MYSWIATIICLIGNIINIYRINFCFYLWILGDVMWVCFDIYQDLYSRAILDFVGLCLAIWGVYENILKNKLNKEGGLMKK